MEARLPSADSMQHVSRQLEEVSTQLARDDMGSTPFALTWPRGWRGSLTLLHALKTVSM